jgi:hypothetical protein
MGMARYQYVNEKGPGDMSDEHKVNDTVDTPEGAEAAGITAAEGKPKKKGKKGRIALVIIGVILVVGIGAGAGVWVWHETPGFCGAICHSPMDPYLATYDAAPGEATQDKYGNAVENANGMMVVTHKEAGEACLDCHPGDIGQQINEGIHWVSGDFTDPLTERTLETLTAHLGYTTNADQEKFCLNDACHADLSKADGSFEEVTADLGVRNPHEMPHGDLACSDCHKAHRASTNACTQCHADAPMPDGWIKYSEANTIKKAAAA